jgi:hypothetical protein
MRGEPVSFLAGGLLIFFRVAQIEHLDFNAATGQCAGLEVLESGVARPYKDARIAARAQMSPLRHELEVGAGLL